jgi:dUTP pyrophosphatase
MIWINVKKVHPDATIPVYATAGSSGLDITCINNERLLPNHANVVRTGLAFEIPQGWELQVRPRSGLAKKYGLSIVNSPGTIDSDFRGEVCVLLHAHVGVDLPAGTRIAQLVPQHVPMVAFKEVDQLEETARGEGGFGHTGMV